MSFAPDDLARANECKATQRYITHFQSSQDEADRKMILHAVDAVFHGATEVNPLSEMIPRLLSQYELCYWN